MILTTNGIVLRAFRHSDNSMVAKVYTEELGLKSFIINVGRGGIKSKNKSNLLQPLSCLEMVVYHKENMGMPRINEANSSYIFSSIPFDTIKSSLALFMAEIIYRSIKEEEKNGDLFGFFLDEIKALDLIDNAEVNNFHLKFMVNFSRFLGFFPGNQHFQSSVFDLSEGMFMHQNKINEFRLEEQLSVCLHRVIEATEQINAQPIKITALERKSLLRALIDYYNFHLPGMGEMKSQDVLETVLND